MIVASAHFTPPLPFSLSLLPWRGHMLRPHVPFHHVHPGRRPLVPLLSYQMRGGSLVGSAFLRVRTEMKEERGKRRRKRSPA